MTTLEVTSRQFLNNSKKFFELADSGNRIIVKRGKKQAYALAPVDDDEYTEHIPPEYLCNPYDISPSGDRYWADRRNVEKLNEALEIAEKQIKEGKYTVCKTYEESLKFFDTL